MLSSISSSFVAAIVLVTVLYCTVEFAATVRDGLFSGSPLRHPLNSVYGSHTHIQAEMSGSDGMR
jgi:hypothetical protein